jgi:hypothetical protein
VILFLALIVVAAVVGIGLHVEMCRRNEPFLGVVGLMVLSGTGVASCGYGILNSL